MCRLVAVYIFIHWFEDICTWRLGCTLYVLPPSTHLQSNPICTMRNSPLAHSLLFLRLHRCLSCLSLNTLSTCTSTTVPPNLPSHTPLHCLQLFLQWHPDYWSGTATFKAWIWSQTSTCVLLLLYMETTGTVRNAKMLQFLKHSWAKPCISNKTVSHRVVNS